MKVNAIKSKHIIFTLRKGIPPPISLNNATIPQTKTVTYLGMHLNPRLIWKQHIWKKIDQGRIKRGTMYWFIGKHSKVNADNKLLVYKS